MQNILAQKLSLVTHGTQLLHIGIYFRYSGQHLNTMLYFNFSSVSGVDTSVNIWMDRWRIHNVAYSHSMGAKYYGGAPCHQCKAVVVTDDLLVWQCGNAGCVHQWVPNITPFCHKFLMFLCCISVMQNFISAGSPCVIIQKPWSSGKVLIRREPSYD